jgi:hypothetical protein
VIQSVHSQSPSTKILTSAWNLDISLILSIVRFVSIRVDMILVILIRAIAKA